MILFDPWIGDLRGTLWSVKKRTVFLTELSVWNYTSDYVAVPGAASPRGGYRDQATPVWMRSPESTLSQNWAVHKNQLWRLEAGLEGGIGGIISLFWRWFSGCWLLSASVGHLWKGRADTHLLYQELGG